MHVRHLILAALALALLTAWPLAADTLRLKQQAKNAYEQEKYPEALALVREAVKANPKDAEGWYLLARYMHFRSYDSRPWSGFSRATSDSVLSYLAEAVRLDPRLGDAYYFIGAEYGARFEQPFCNGDTEKAKVELILPREKNAFPDWMLEYCRNVLRSCDSSAILFLMGDLQVNGVRYLQLVENYRRDITAIPWPLLDRPWVARLFKDGVPGALIPAPISWSSEQIMDMHAYRWKTDTVRIPVKTEALGALGISGTDSVLNWEVKPDLSAGDRPMMSAIQALEIDIIETNQWRRPVYFALCPAQATAGIDSCLQSCGLVQRLLPVPAAKYGRALDTLTMERVLLDPASYRYFPGVKQHDMPRVSPILNMYRAGLIELASSYAERDDQAACQALLDRMEKLLPESILPARPDHEAAIKQLRSKHK